MTESIIIDGAKVTQLGESDFGGLNTLGRQFINGVEIFPSSGGTNPFEEAITQVDHGFTVGKVLYNTGAGYALADNSDVSTADAEGVVTQVTDADNFVIQVVGRAVIGFALTAGAQYYLITNGDVTTVQPTGNDIIAPIFKATSTTVGNINISTGAEASPSWPLFLPIIMTVKRFLRVRLSSSRMVAELMLTVIQR